MKKIGLIPTVIKRRNSICMILDTNLLKFIKKCFPKYQLKILFSKEPKESLNLIISPGGNSVLSIKNNDPNKLRKALDDYYFNYCIKNDIPFLGICHGAQYIAKNYRSKIIKKKNHTRKKHFIELHSKKRVQVNSYHNFSVVELGKSLSSLASSKDGSIEAFQHKYKSILGIMWHPERYKKIKKFDINFISKYIKKKKLIKFI